MRKLRLICDCGCKSQVLIQFDKEVMTIDTRDEGRKKWHGVVLYKDKMKKVENFLK